MTEPARITPDAFGEVVKTAPTVARTPVWYQSPVAAIPLAAAAFLIGNVLMMLHWPG